MRSRNKTTSIRGTVPRKKPQARLEFFIYAFNLKTSQSRLFGSSLALENVHVCTPFIGSWPMDGLLDPHFITGFFDDIRTNGDERWRQ